MPASDCGRLNWSSVALRAASASSDAPAWSALAPAISSASSGASRSASAECCAPADTARRRRGPTGGSTGGACGLRGSRELNGRSGQLVRSCHTPMRLTGADLGIEAFKTLLS
jgi:hypothetical protein